MDDHNLSSIQIENLRFQSYLDHTMPYTKEIDMIAIEKEDNTQMSSTATDSNERLHEDVESQNDEIHNTETDLLNVLPDVDLNV